MEAKEMITLSLDQAQEYLDMALDGLTQEEAAWSPGPESNSIAFIFWHIARVEDFFVNRVIQRLGEVYSADGWVDKLGTPAKGTGFQYTLEQLRDWPVPKIEVLREYAGSVRGKTLSFIRDLAPEKLSEVPRPEQSPDSIGETLRHITTEIGLHIGQIYYLRGMQRGLGK